jgi:hypothetical protein
VTGDKISFKKVEGVDRRAAARKEGERSREETKPFA